VDQALRVRRDTEQHVLEIRKRREVHQFAALDERIEQRRTARGLEAAGEEPVLAVKGDNAQLVLGAVVVNGQAAILDKPLQRTPLVRQIPEAITHLRQFEK
jgi:hypothetical protein